jgi:hypothetical protein
MVKDKKLCNCGSETLKATFLTGLVTEIPYLNLCLFFFLGNSNIVIFSDHRVWGNTLRKRFVYFFFFQPSRLAVPVFILSPDSRAFCEESVSGLRLFLSYLLRLLLPRKYPTVVCNVGNPDPVPFSQRYGSGSGSFPFLIKVLSGLKCCL